MHPHGASICAGPAMDSQILRDLFATLHPGGARSSASTQDFRAACAATRAKLPPDRIGKAGQLQEWLEDWDMEAPERDHRHVSHLYALFPSEQINVRRTPELAAAAQTFARAARRPVHGLGHRLAHQPLGAAARRRAHALA